LNFLVLLNTRVVLLLLKNIISLTEFENVLHKLNVVDKDFFTELHMK